MSDRLCLVPIWTLIVSNGVSVMTAAVLLLRSAAVPRVWAIHGAMMIVAWGCLLPLGGIVARYFKVTPTQAFPAVADNPFWWNWHRVLQYSGVALAAAALGVILNATHGRFDTLHGRCGVAVMSLTGLQLASPLFRGSKGGPTGARARPDDLTTWRGDHYDMTLRRRLFEAWHKRVGWALILFAQMTLVLGASLAGGQGWLLGLLGMASVTLILAIGDSHLRGRWVDTHVALWGPHGTARGEQKAAAPARHPIEPAR